MIERSNLQSLGYELIREAIITWLYKIVDRDKDK
jgi:hypothetical protein